MLEQLPRLNITQDVHRFANVSRVAAWAAKEGLTIDEVTEVIAFARDDVTKELMEGPFQRKPFFGNNFGPHTRFSNGEWPVFYTAVGHATAEREATYHYGRKAAGDAAARRAVHYSIVRMTFSGDIMDLRPMIGEWPDLISNDYTFCNGLGHEAHAGRVGGFLSPSARNPGGTTVPAFMSETLSHPAIEATATLTFDEGATKVQVTALP
jgi:RES domain